MNVKNISKTINKSIELHNNGFRPIDRHPIGRTSIDLTLLTESQIDRIILKIKIWYNLHEKYA